MCNRWHLVFSLIILLAFAACERKDVATERSDEDQMTDVDPITDVSTSEEEDLNLDGDDMLSDEEAPDAEETDNVLSDTETDTDSDADIMAPEEFLGPFPSWKNVRDYGAVGDGVSDDTNAIQTALDDARDVVTNAWSVLYFPAGTYRITKTLRVTRSGHNDYLGFSIIGEDPATTILLWDGPGGRDIFDGGDMFHLDMWYGKVSRLTFDGNGKATVGLYRGDRFSTFCELSDLWFKDMVIGVVMGYSGSAGQAEHLVLRCRFERCSQAGVFTWNWNTLDIWIWHSLFEDCGYGVYNEAGNFHVYESVFLRSQQADIGSSNLETFSFVGNTSVGSQAFLNFENFHTWSAQVLVKNNRIYDVTGPYAIVTGTGGPWLLVDNMIRNREEATGPAVRLTASAQILVNNTFTVAEPLEVEENSWRGPLRVHEIDSIVKERSEIQEPDIHIPDPPRSFLRKVFEVARNTGDDAHAIQEQIDAAAKESAGTRPVVHVPKGFYTLRRTIMVPAGSEIQLVGDGTLNGTIIDGSEIPSGPAIRLEGPSRAIVRDMEIRGNAQGLVIENADQPGGRIYARLISASGRSPSEPANYSILVEGVEQSDVNIIGGNFGNAKHGIVVIGGPERSMGKKAPGQVSLFTGASSHAGKLYEVREGGELLAEAVWYEGGLFEEGGTGIRLASSGRLTLVGTFIATPLEDESQPLVELDGFRGDFAFLLGSSIHFDIAPAHHVHLMGDGSAMRTLFAGDMFWFDRTLSSVPADSEFFWRDETLPQAEASFFFNTINSGQDPVFEHLSDVTNGEKGAGPSDDFLRDLLSQLREARIKYPDCSPGTVTDVKLLTVYISCGADGTALSIRR